jgi:transposase
MRPLSVDLRERVVRSYHKTKETLAQVAARFHVGEATVNRWVSQHRRTGRLDPRPHGGGPAPKVDERGLSLLCELLAEQPDATRQEVAQRYKEETGVELSVETVGRELNRLGLTRKKRPSTPASETPRR